jgi:hypothetical protein
MCTEGVCAPVRASAVCGHQREDLVSCPPYALQVDLRLSDAPRMFEQKARSLMRRNLNGTLPGNAVRPPSSGNLR